VIDASGLSEVKNITFSVIDVLLKGDIDNNNKIDLKDAILAMKVLVSIADETIIINSGTDINFDNKYGFEELIFILQKISKGMTNE